MYTDKSYRYISFWRKCNAQNSSTSTLKQTAQFLCPIHMPHLLIFELKLKIFLYIWVSIKILSTYNRYLLTVNIPLILIQGAFLLRRTNMKLSSSKYISTILIYPRPYVYLHIKVNMVPTLFYYKEKIVFTCSCYII